MDKDEIVSLLNSFLQTQDINLAITIIDRVNPENNDSNKRNLIMKLLILPGIGNQCIEYAINTLCSRYKINSITKNNLTISFY